MGVHIFFLGLEPKNWGFGEKKKKKKSDGPKKSYRGPREVFGPTKNRLGGETRGGPKFKKIGLISYYIINYI